MAQEAHLTTRTKEMIPTDLAHLYSLETRAAQPSPIRDICALVARPEMCSLAGGWPDPDVFPVEDIGLIFTDLLATAAGEMFQYGSTEGLLELRQILARRMEAEGAPGLGTENLVITHGSSQGMSLAAQVFIDPGDVVLVGLPTYFGGPGAVRARGGEPAGVPVDQEGLNVDPMAWKLEELKKAGRKVKGVYVIPNFQNPAGVTLSLARRRRLIELAREHDLVIFEDDPYGELRFEGRPLPSLFSLDHERRVIHLRSMSKTFVPGLRLGWAAGSAQVIRRMVVAKQYMDAATNTTAQFILLEYIKRGLLDRRIKGNIQYYRAKRDFMLEQLDRHFPSEVRWNRPEGGFFIFVYLPEGWDASELFKEAVERNVAFVIGQPFFVDGRGRNTLRLSFSQAGLEDMAAAIKELGALIKKRLASKAGGGM